MRYLRFIFGLTGLCFILASPAMGDVYAWTINVTCDYGHYIKFSNVKNTDSGDIYYRFPNGSSVKLKHKAKSYNAVTGVWARGQFEGTLHYASGFPARVWIQYDESGTNLSGWGRIGNAEDCELSGTRIAMKASSGSNASSGKAAVDGFLGFRQQAYSRDSNYKRCYTTLINADLPDNSKVWPEILNFSPRIKQAVSILKQRGISPLDCARILGRTTYATYKSNPKPAYQPRKISGISNEKDIKPYLPIHVSTQNPPGNLIICSMAFDKNTGTWD